MKAIIIGGGAVAEMFHIPALRKRLKASQTIVAESSAAQRDKLAAAFPDITLIEGYRQMPEDVSFAIIATPPHTHVELIQYCAERSLPVLCEKPVAFSAQSLDDVISKIQANQVTAGVCHTFRFFPNRLELRKRIQEGFFGDSPEIEILEGDPTTWSPVSGYNFRKEITPGGVLLDGGIHSLDFIVWCLGKPSGIDYEDDSLGGLESNARLTLSFPGSAKSFFRISRTCALPNTVSVSGNGHNASLGIFNFGELTLNGKKLSVSDKYPGEASDWSNIADVQLNNFITSIEQKNDPRCTLAEAAQSIKIIEKCYQLKSQRPVPGKLPLPGLTF